MDFLKLFDDSEKNASDSRSLLVVGSKCEIYVDSQRKWFPGEVTEITNELLTIVYTINNYKKIKQINKFDKHVRGCVNDIPKQDEKKEENESNIDEKSNFGTYVSKTDKTPKLSTPLFFKDGQLKNLFEHNCKYEINKKTGGITFYPSPHLKESDLGTKNDLIQHENFEKSWRLKRLSSKLEIGKIEMIYDWNTEIASADGNICSFITAAERAYSKHFPLKISPSQIFVMILQAIAINVDQHSEKLRDKFVKHQGKMKLVVNRASETFIPGKRDNPWDGVIAEFVQQIDQNTIEDTAKLMDCNFSTATFVDKISAKVTIMDICKNYFEYVLRCMPMCGFPKITLDGSKQDWINLRNKVATLLANKVDKRFGAKWSKSLLPVLDRFINSYDGNICCVFWNSMIKRGYKYTRGYGSGGGSSRTWYTGWFNVFFPYLTVRNGFVENHYCVPYSLESDYVCNGLKEAGDGNEIDRYPIGLSSAPVKWEYIGCGEYPSQNMDLKFVSGIIGYTQDSKSLEISAKMGWLVGHTEKKDTKKNHWGF